jgi:REP element-mobilizing transposase RayT
VDQGNPIQGVLTPFRQRGFSHRQTDRAIFPNHMSSRAYYEMYFHITWHTKSSRPLITPAIEPDLYKFIRDRIFATDGAIVHAIGGIETHVHVAVSLPPALQPAEWMARSRGQARITSTNCTARRRCNGRTVTGS